MTMLTEPRLLREKEAAAFFGRSTRTMRRWRAEGLLPWVRLPYGGVAYRQADLADFVTSRLRDHGGEPATCSPSDDR